jgi:hypothetical protein
MSELKCTHTWQTTGQCDQTPVGFLCYEVSGLFGDQKGVYVAIGCEQYLSLLGYHRNHSGVGIIAAWSLESSMPEAAAEELRESRPKFERLIANSASGPNRDSGITSALTAYDALIDKLAPKEYSIEDLQKELDDDGIPYSISDQRITFQQDTGPTDMSGRLTTVTINGKRYTIPHGYTLAVAGTISSLVM